MAISRSQIPKQISKPGLKRKKKRKKIESKNKKRIQKA